MSGEHPHPEFALDGHTHDLQGHSHPPTDERLAAIEARLSALGGPSEPIPPEIVYGRREGPRAVDSAPYLDELTVWDGEEISPPFKLDLTGRSLPRSLLPRYPMSTMEGSTIANGVIFNDNESQVALYMHAKDITVVDVESSGFENPATVWGHGGALDAKDADGLKLINVTIPDAAFHGAEVAGYAEVRGSHIAGRHVGLAGYFNGGGAYDSVFTYLGGGSGSHHGAVKMGLGRGEYHRCNFDGLFWMDGGAAADIEDGLFRDGAHFEVSQNRAQTVSPSRVWHSDFEGGPVNERYISSRNPGHIQSAQLNVHMGHVRAERCKFNLSLNDTFVYTEWDDKRPMPGWQMVSDGVLSDSLIEATHDPSQPLNGGLVRWQHSDQNRWERVVIRIPEAARDLKLCVVQHEKYQGGANTWNEWLTADEFVAKYAPTCNVEGTG